MTRMLQQIITGVSALAVALSPVLAVPSFGQGISGAGVNAPEVLRSANNTPLVMIETPNGAGVSHNTYDSFDIDNRGAILNNIDANYGRTQLGGYVQGNDNLTNGPASVIINEVITNNPSELSGYLEVGGSRADVVIANPYGITCDGCGFINTDRATITTGTPQLASDGSLNAIDVNRGHVKIGERGLDATGVSQFDLLSRTVEFAGVINGKNVRVVAGRNNVIYATGEVEVKGDDGGEAPAIAIDSTVLGGMYANKITINSTERGVGVRAPETMAANAGEMHITADGRLVMGAASAKRVVATSRNSDVEIKRQIAAAEQAEVNAARDLVIAANGQLVSDAALSVKTGRDVVLQNGASAGSQQAGVNINAGGKVDLGASAQLIAAQDLTLQSQGLSLGTKALIAADGRGTIATEALALNGGALQAGGDLSVTGGAIEIAGGQIQSGKALSVTATGISGANHSLSAGDALHLTAGTVALGDGRIVAGGNAVLRADRFAAGGVIGSQDGALEITTTTGDLQASGALSAAKNIRVTSAGTATLGHVQAGEVLTIDAAGDVTGQDAFTSGGVMEITTGGSLRGLALHAGVDVVAKASGDILIGDDPETAGNLLPHQDAAGEDGEGDPTTPEPGETDTETAPPSIADAGETGENEFTITPGLRIGDVRAGNDIDLTAGGRIVIGNSAVAERDISLDAGKLIDISALQLGGELSTQSGTGDTRIGTLIVTGDFALDVDGALALDQVAAPGSLTLTAGSLVLGGAAAGTDLVLTASDGDLAASGNLLANHRITLDASGAVSAGQIVAKAAIDVTTGKDFAAKTVQSDSTVKIDAGGKLGSEGLIDGDQGVTLVSGGQLSGTAVQALQGAVDITAGGDVALTDAVISQAATDIASTGALTLNNLQSGANLLLNAGGDLRLNGNATAATSLTTAAGGQFVLAGADAADQGHHVIAGDALSVTAAGLQLGDHAQLASRAGDITLTGHGMSSLGTGATIVGSKAVSFTGTGLTLASKAAVLADGPLTLTAAQITAGADSLLQSNDGALELRGQNGALEVTGGMLRAATDLDVEAGRVAIRNSNLGASKALTLTASSGDLSFVDGTANASSITMRADTGDAAIGGGLSSAGAITLDAAGDLIHSASVTTPKTLTLLAGGTLSDSGRGVLPDGSAQNAAHLGALSLTGGTVQAGGDYLVAGDAAITATTGSATTSGRITSGALLKVASATAMINSGALNAATLNIKADSINNSGTLTGASNLVLTATQQGIINSGEITAGKTMALNAKAAINNQSKGVISVHYGISTIEAASLSNAGTIGLMDAKLTLAGDLRNSDLLSANTTGTIGGTLINSGRIQGGSHVLTIANLTNSGSFQTDQKIALTMSGSDINNSGVLHGGTVTIDKAATITNTATGEISGGALTLKGQSLNNAGEIIATGQSQINLTGGLTNSGLIQNGQSAAGSVIHAATVTNSGDIISDQGKLTVQAAKSFANTGKLSGRGQNSYLAVHANDMTKLGQIAADGTLELANASGGMLKALNVTKDENIVTKGALLIKATNITNAGGIAGKGGLTLEGDKLTNKGSIYSEADMALRFRDLIDNDGGSILAVNGGLTVSGREKNADGSYKALTRLINQRGGRIETLLGQGAAADTNLDMSFNIGKLENKGLNVSFSEEVVKTSTPEVLIASSDNGECGGRFHNCTYRSEEITVTTDRAKVSGSRAKILSGGNITFDGRSVYNDYSQIEAAGVITFDLDEIRNTGADLFEVTDVLLKYRNSVDDERFGGADNYYWNEVGPSKTTRLQPIFGTIHARNDIKGVVGYVENGAVSKKNVGVPTLEQPNGLTPLAASNTRTSSTGGALIGGGTVVTADMLSFTPDQAGLGQGVAAAATRSLGGAAGLTLSGAQGTAAQVTGPNGPALSGGGFVNLGAIGNDNLFVVNQNPSTKYLVETRHEFIDQSNFLSSDYFLDALNFDPEATQMRLGDGMVETWLIRDQLFDQTGRNLLVGQGSEYDQLRAMYDNAAAQARALGLVPGVSLTADQVKALTSDIVWLEEATVSGRKVLIPRVYLTEKTIRANAKGAATIIGDQGVNLKVGELINNGGVIGSTQGQTVIASAGDIQNDYGLIFGGKNAAPGDNGFALPSVVLNAKGNYTSTSGLVTGEDIVIQATDILVKTDVKRIKIGDNGNYADVAGPTAGIRGSGDIALSAIRDIRLTGADLNAQGDVTAIAGGEIDLGAVRLDTELGSQTGKNYTYLRTTRHQTSDITAGGNVALISTGEAAGADGVANVTLAGSDINAGGTIGIAAEKGNVLLGSVGDEFYSDQKRSKKKLFSKKTSRDQVYDLTNNTTSLSGSQIDIYAKGDVLAQGTQFTAGGLSGEDAVDSGNLRITSESGDIDFVAVENIHAEKHEKSKKILGGLFSSDSTTEDVLSDMQGAKVTTTGDLDLSAVQGSVLFQGGDYRGVGGKVNVDAKETYLQGTIDSRYSFEHSNDNNGFVITDKTRVTVDETPEAPLFNKDALSINGDVHVGGRDGSPQLVRGATIESLGPQGILAAQNAGESDGSGGNGASPHWTQNFTEQYGGDAQTRQVALADVTGPGTEYLRELDAVATGDVTYGKEAELLDVHYHEVTKQAGVLTKAAIALASGGNAWAAFALNTAADGIISGEIDLKNVVKDAVFTAFTAGVDVGGVQFEGMSSYAGNYADALGLSNQSVLGPRAGDLLSANSIAAGLIDAAATGVVQTGLYNGNLGENILNNAGSFAANQTMAVGFYGAGEFKSINHLGTGSVGGIASHLLAGCAGGAVTGAGCAEGAIAAGANEFAAGQGWNSDAIKLTNTGIAVLLSKGDPASLGQLSGVTASADRYNRELHEIEAKRLEELKVGKTKEEQQRLDAAACYLIRCAAGIPKDDPNYETTAAMQKLGEGYQEEIDLLRGQSRDRPYTFFGLFPTSQSTYQESLFGYSSKDGFIDPNLQNGNLVRAGGVLMATGGLAEGMAGYLSCMKGPCTIVSTGAIAQGGDYIAAGVTQIWDGRPVTPLGEHVLQGFGLSPDWAAAIYGATAVGTEGVATLRTATGVVRGADVVVPPAGATKERELFSLRSTSFDPMDPEQFTRIQEAFARQGKVIDNSEDALRYLETRGADGVTFNAGTILVRPDASPSTVFEELIHTTQHRTGRYDQWTSRYGNAGATAKAEYEAATRLVNNQRAYGITDAENAVNQVRVQEFGRQLDDMGVPRD